MDPNNEVTWIVTRNTVKDRMINSSLIHKFSDSKKFQKSTRLLNKLLGKYRSLNKYQDYVKMKKLIKKKVCVDIEVEDEENFGEDDYSILHKINFSSKNNIKESKDSISNKEDALICSIPNKIISTVVKIPKENKKRLRTSKFNNENDDEALHAIKKKRLKKSPKQCLKNKEKIHPIINKKNSSNSLNTNNMDTSLQASKNYTTAVFDTKDNNSVVDDTKNKEQIDNLVNKNEIMKDTVNEPSMQMNHLQLPHKYLMEEEICQDIIDAKQNEDVDHFEISNVNHVQEIVSHNANDIQNIESSFHDVKHDVIPIKQEQVICSSNVIHNDMNLNDIANEESNNSICSPNSVLQLQKSPPKVKSTEIINKKYKIVNKENSCCELLTECYNNIKFLGSSTPLSYPKCDENEELKENEVYEGSISSSVISQSEKRIRQLKMLNLSLESTSSSSEDEIPKLKDNFNKTTVLNDSISKTLENSTTSSKLKLNRSQDICKKDKSFHSLQNINNSTDHQHNACTKDLSKHKKISSKSSEPKVQTLGERPCNLENFIKKAELMQDTTASTFTLTDFSDDEEIFLMDMPITVTLADLQGKKMLLKNTLKLGTNKYEIFYKDIPAQSCVFSTCKDSEPYKLKNIKPRGSILVKRKLFPLSVPKYSKHGTKSYHNVHKNK